MVRILLSVVIFLIGCGEVRRSEFDGESLLRFHNIHRVERNLDLFVMDRRLSDYAGLHSERMSRRGFLFHSRVGVLLMDFGVVGENIAYNQKDEFEVTQAWMSSVGHRGNILNRSFRRIGFGMSRGVGNGAYWTAVFGD